MYGYRQLGVLRLRMKKNILKKYLSIADMLPHHHITYKDISALT
jgi:hypothetical protein